MSNRELKFRAWDTKTNKYMWPWQADDPQGFVLFGEVTCFDAIGQQFKKEDNRLLRYNDLVIEQYTGLNDKNGREIYEGDIIGIPNIIPIVVSFDRGAFIQNTVGPYCSLLDFISEHSVFGAPEVIGNIHENPNLLGHNPGPSAE